MISTRAATRQNHITASFSQRLRKAGPWGGLVKEGEQALVGLGRQQVLGLASRVERAHLGLRQSSALICVLSVPPPPINM